MINFTGLTKKRVVNLGNRSRSGLSGNYLEQQRLQRLAREEQRTKERRLALLKEYVGRYLEMRKIGDDIAKEWRDNVGTTENGGYTEIGNSTNHLTNYIEAGTNDSDHAIISNNSDNIDESATGGPHTPTSTSTFTSTSASPNITNRHQDQITHNNSSASSLWVVQFQFISKWAIPHQSVELTVNDLNLLHTRLCNLSTLSDRESTVLTTCLVYLIDRFANNTQIIQIILKCIQFLVKEGSDFPGLVSRLSGLIVSSQMSVREYGLHPDILSTCIDLCFLVNFADSQANFLRFLTIPGIFTASQANLVIVRGCRFDLEEVHRLENYQLINLLCNYLEIHGSEPFTLEDFMVIGSLLQCVTFSLQKDDEEESSSILAEEELLLVDDYEIKKVQELYSSQFIQQTIDYFVKEDRVQPLSSTTSVNGIIILSTLIHLYPPLKNKLCMLITITPNSYKLFYHQIRATSVYRAFSENDGDYLKSLQLDGLDPPLYFWKSVYAFEELYSYWLIVSNDLESFQDDKLHLDDVVDFLKFLRTLALTVIFQGEYFSQQLKTVSLALLNQLYLKNLRLHFLPDNFWTPRELTINVNGMLQFVAEEEERRILDDEDEVKPARVPSEMVCKLEVLKKLPFFISFRDRVQIFQSLIELDRQRNTDNPYSFIMPQSKLQADIRRSNLLTDAYEAYHHAGSTFKNQLQVSFYNEYGKEAGIDGGGITKEFLTSVVSEGFDPNNGLFKETASHQVYPSDDIYMKLTKRRSPEIQSEKLQYFKFLGNVLGKCFYENVLIDISFAPFFLNKWCSMKNSINDLRTLDEELFRNLLKLIKMDGDELEALELTFSINEVVDGKSFVFELVPGGEYMKVDLTNKLNYIHQVSNFKLNQSLHVQTKWFLEGLYEIISASWLSMFDSFELQMLISGGENDVNIQDWKENVEYGGYFDDDVTVQYFWEVVEEMNKEERCKLLKFVTSVGRAPLLGFGALSPKFGIRNSGSDVERLPTASTCVNLLKLPDYKNKELMRSKLMYLISMGSGFDLS